MLTMTALETSEDCHDFFFERVDVLGTLKVKKLPSLIEVNARYYRLIKSIANSKITEIWIANLKKSTQEYLVSQFPKAPVSTSEVIWLTSTESHGVFEMIAVHVIDHEVAVGVGE
jgi:hypothetical protein